MEPDGPCEGDWTTTLWTDEDGEQWWYEDNTNSDLKSIKFSMVAT